MIEDGLTYEQLRGVSIEGTGVVIDDADALWKVGVNVFERYTGPYTEEMKPFVEMMLNKRVAVRVEVERMRSWDHNRLLAAHHLAAQVGQRQRAVITLDREQPGSQQLPDHASPLALGQFTADAERGQRIVPVGEHPRRLSNN